VGGCKVEPSIRDLDERTDYATKVMLNNVVKRKKKYERLKSRHLFVMSFTLFFSFCYLLYLYMKVAVPYSHSFSAMFSAFVNDSANLYFLFVAMGSFGLMNLLREKRDKAEKEFHALRCEIIDKSKDLWKKEEAWSGRHIVFEMMQEKFDINLYHENK
jgi:hypothetical protein